MLHFHAAGVLLWLSASWRQFGKTVVYSAAAANFLVAHSFHLRTQQHFSAASPTWRQTHFVTFFIVPCQYFHGNTMLLQALIAAAVVSLGGSRKPDNRSKPFRFKSLSKKLLSAKIGFLRCGNDSAIGIKRIHFSITSFFIEAVSGTTRPAY